MSTKTYLLFLLLFAALSVQAQQQKNTGKRSTAPKQFVTPGEGHEQPELYKEIVHIDSLYFGTYNTCDLVAMRKMTADDFEFYHNKSGLDTSAESYINAIKNNICGKVTRELVPGSIEVYPIANYGAVEIGYHRFINKAEGNHVSRPGKFIVIWHKSAEGWQMARVVSLH